MKLLRISVPLVSMLLLACGGGLEDPGPCTSGRTCPVACQPSQSCSGGAICQDGYCSQATPTAAVYAACALDADCPRGDYCSLGACAHDCVLDRDCSTGLVCSSRGRCITVEQIYQPAPVEQPEAGSAAGLQVSPGALDFGRSQVQQSLGLSNTQGTPLTYRVLSSRPWVTVEPASGTVSGVSQALAVSVDRTVAGADTHATLSINSTSGNAKVEVFIGRDLSGHYAGTVQITQPYELATSTLQVNLFQSADGGTLSGYVDPERSLLFPYRSAVSGTITGDDVTLSLVVAGAKGTLANPHYPVPIQRTVTLAGKVTGSGVIAGTVQDSVSGPLETPVALSGTFQLERTGAAVEGEAEPAPQLPPVTVQDPFSNSRYDTCKTQCPSPGSCGTEIAWGDAYLKLAANFYQAFQTAAGSADPKDPNTYPFYSVIATNCNGQGCLDQQGLWCAQYHYVQALSNSSTRSAASIRLLDTLEVLADYAMLTGHNQMAQAMDSWKQSGTTLAGEVPILQAAGNYFTVGNHSDNTLPQAMLDPYYLRLLTGSSFDTSALASNVTNLDELLGDYADGRAAYEHLRRQALAIGGALRSVLEIAERQHRLGDLAASLVTARQGAMQAYLDLALLARVLVVSGATAAAFSEATAILRDFEQLSHRFDQVNGGRNPAGYFDGFVPLLAKANDPGTNFQQIWSFADGYYTRLAKVQADAARTATREYEAQGATLSTQVQSQQTALQEQILSLCGEASFSGSVDLSFCDVAVCGRVDALGQADFSFCGKPGSEMKREVSAFKAAMDRLAQVQTRIDNVAKEMVIERDRALQVSGIHEAQANLILENGQKIISIDQQIRAIDEASSFFGGLMHLFVGIATIPMGGAGGIASGLSTLAGVGGSLVKGPLEDQKTAILTMQSAQVEFNIAHETLVNSAALIKTKLLECATLEYDRLIAVEGLSQAADALLSLSRRANLLQAQYNRLNFQSSIELNRLLQFRVYADNLTLQAQESLRELMSRAFLATRAFEYELNVSYADTGKLWQMRSADEVAKYLENLWGVYFRQGTIQPQVNVDVISVRDDLLDMNRTITDQVTGQVYSPRERFRRYVADPLNRDADGNLRIPFSTHRPDKQIFSRAVCSDRVQKVRVNLIGDSLGAGLSYAYVKLLQGGVTYLRQCGGGHDLVSYDLSGDQRDSGSSSSQVMTGFGAPRVARIQAGINAASGAPLMVDNTDLAWRGILAGQWELVIDQRPEMEPQNQGLDLRDLDDIEITFVHDAYTIQ